MAAYIDTNMEIKSYLTFELGEEIFACHVNKLLHILEIPNITEVPGAPAYMKGIIDLRGKVLPVIDTKIKMGMPPVEVTKDTCIVVMDINLDDDSLLVGVLVDKVMEVLEFNDDEILPPPNLGSKYHSDFITGIVNRNEKFIMIIDIDTIFSLDEIDFMRDNSENDIVAEIEDDDAEESDKNE
ncbi:MAG: chemotaxis protein CheW [Bacteroidales bacterium]|nr:chemotaxis protein CheW [Bacteroidales bacterium]